MDFGGLKPVKKFLEDTFDHKTIVAVDDPELGALQALECMSLTVLPRVGCEAFAEHIGLWVQDWLTHQLWNYNVRRTPGGQEYRVNRVNLHHCEVREHGANSAIWFRD
jgi:6-pyruvoyltetrahydropterin/6-carboxytetrahydropterin synthase